MALPATNSLGVPSKAMVSVADMAWRMCIVALTANDTLALADIGVTAPTRPLMAKVNVIAAASAAGTATRPKLEELIDREPTGYRPSTY